jgi:hypothetical protein
MADHHLLPWMLHADWRNDDRRHLLVDMASWPLDLPIHPLPPVPIIGIGPPDHPLALGVDIVEDEAIPFATLTAAIARHPHASATLVQLLRTIEGQSADAALTSESFAYAMLQAGAEHAVWQGARPLDAARPAGHVTVTRNGSTIDVLLDRPWARNAIDRSMRDALFDAFSLAEIDRTIMTVRLRGAGRCFSVGADLAEFGTSRDPAVAHAIRMRTLPARALVGRQAILETHVQGACVGSGLELAAFASRLTATADAWFQLPEVGMGILPGAGGCLSIPQRIGRQRATLLMLSGKRINARTALRWGLVDAILDM